MGTVISRVVSGGQTGVDRAALDIAIQLGIPYGGWCPKDGYAEDLVDPPGLLSPYPGLKETPTADPGVRTRWNVRDSDATLVIRGTGASPGTDLTETVAQALGRPLAVVSEVAEAHRLLEQLPEGAVLNVAGPRESEEPGAYERARMLLLEVLSR